MNTENKVILDFLQTMQKEQKEQIQTMQKEQKEQIQAIQKEQKELKLITEEQVQTIRDLTVEVTNSKKMISQILGHTTEILEFSKEINSKLDTVTGIVTTLMGKEVLDNRKDIDFNGYVNTVNECISNVMQELKPRDTIIDKIKLDITKTLKDSNYKTLTNFFIKQRENITNKRVRLLQTDFHNMEKWSKEFDKALVNNPQRTIENWCMLKTYIKNTSFKSAPFEQLRKMTINEKLNTVSQGRSINQVAGLMDTWVELYGISLGTLERISNEVYSILGINGKTIQPLFDIKNNNEFIQVNAETSLELVKK